MFVCPIMTQEPVNRFASNFDGGTRKNHGNVQSLVCKDSKFSGLTLKYKLVIKYLNLEKQKSEIN